MRGWRRFAELLLGLQLAGCGAAALSGGRWPGCDLLGFAIPALISLPAGVLLVFDAVGAGERESRRL